MPVDAEVVDPVATTMPEPLVPVDVGTGVLPGW